VIVKGVAVGVNGVRVNGVAVNAVGLNVLVRVGVGDGVGIVSVFVTV